MARQYCCPHYVSYGGGMYGCLNGHFPCDCENCDCKEKIWYETRTLSQVPYIDFTPQPSDSSLMLYGLYGKSNKD